MNKSLAIHYFKLSADQGSNLAQHLYAEQLLSGTDVQKDEKLGVEYLQRAADQGLIPAQLRLAALFHQGRVIPRDMDLSARYFKRAADQGSAEGQIKYAECILNENRVPGIVRRRESEHYLRLAATQEDSRAQIRLGIGLLSGLFGRFDFLGALTLFEQASKSGSDSGWTRFAFLLHDLLSVPDCTLLSSDDFSQTANVFSVLRSSLDESIPLIRILNVHLADQAQLADHMLSVWQEVADFILDYLVDLSQGERTPIPSNQRTVLRSLPSDLALCNSIPEMTSLIFRMYSIESLLYKNVNMFLRCFPSALIGKFMNELGGILRYIYLLQSSIEYFSHMQPLSSPMVVYRGISQPRKMLVPLYESMIGEVIVWPGFTSTSTDRDFVILQFIRKEESMLFEISLHPGDVAVAIHEYSDHENESEVLIAASSGFTVEAVEWVEIRGMNIPQVRLSYCMSWYDFNIDDPPEPILI
jgi:hypothetical protein